MSLFLANTDDLEVKRYHIYNATYSQMVLKTHTEKERKLLKEKSKHGKMLTFRSSSNQFFFKSDVMSKLKVKMHFHTMPNSTR